MEELLAIGGDPTFLEQARGGSGEFEWDGVEDDAAHSTIPPTNFTETTHPAEGRGARGAEYSAAGAG